MGPPYQWTRGFWPRLIIVTALPGLSTISTVVVMRAITRFDQTPGAMNGAPLQWPARSAVSRSKGRPTIVVFAHPFCSCTDATFAELERLSARQNPAEMAVFTFLFFRPQRSGWAPNALCKRAQGLKGARVFWDEDGVEATRFGAQTSGYALLYSSEGKLLFRGGVTGSRGHQGDNYGLDELMAALHTQRPAQQASRVFGCALGRAKQEAESDR